MKMSLCNDLLFSKELISTVYWRCSDITDYLKLYTEDKSLYLVYVHIKDSLVILKEHDNK